MTLKSTALHVQQVMIDNDINVERLENVPEAHLERGVRRIDIFLDMHVGKDVRKAYDRMTAALNKEFELDGSGNYWVGKDDEGRDGSHIAIGIDINDDHQAVVGVEEQTEEYLRSMMGEQRVSKSFKTFFTEARKAGVSYSEEKTKGVVVKVIATLEGHEAGKLTRVARQYHSILKALNKLEEKKKELNAALKDMVGDTFDPELDKYYTRVVASASFAATLAKETKPEDVAEKVEVQYDMLAEGLLKLLTDDLKPAGDALLEACTKRWKPDVKSPNLTVKKLDEGVTDTVRKWWRGLKDAMMTALLRFDKNLSRLEKALETYKKMPKPKADKK